jgi:Ca2+-binding RTX toxin-like protein
MPIFTGTNGADVLTGGADDDALYGHPGADTLTGGDGDDIVIDNVLDIDDNDIAHASPDTSADILRGGNGDDALSGGARDTFDGGPGFDVALINFNGVSNVTVDLRPLNTGGTAVLPLGGSITNVEDGIAIEFFGSNTAYGSDFLEEFYGGLGVDVFYGFGGNDALLGNGGDDILRGGLGSDGYDGGDGIDTVGYEDALSAVTVSLAITTTQSTGGGGVERLISIENLIGSAFNDTLTGSTSANVLDGGAGLDTLRGNNGNDTLNGGIGDDILRGNAGADILNGGDGIDTADYSTDTVAVNVSLDTNRSIEGGVLSDTLTSIENLTGTGLADTLIGNAAANVLTGGGGNDTLDGQSGADTMIGGTGNDLYNVESAGDVVTEAAGGGNDTIYTTINWTLGVNVEVLAAGNANAAINLTGNALNNMIVGNAAQNTMDGGVGADTLIGGAGDDLYVIDNQLDVIIEVAGEGALDTIYTAFTYYQMGANVENTQITGGPGSYVVGNDVNNLLVGNTGADTLVGGIGADTLVGAAGDDFYIIADQDDVIIELAAGGNDTILTSISYYQMGAEVENLEMTGTTGTYAIGNALDNLIVGNLGADTLDGGLGGDFMVGHEGDDLYFVDDLGDRSVESANEGVDAIYTSINWTTGAHIENLVLTGTANLAGGGNELNNFIFGNDGDNAITGALGQDVLTGGAGADTFVYASAAEGGDAITDFVSGVDRFSISAVGFGGGLVGGGAAALVAGSDPTSLTASFLYDTDDGALYWDSDGDGGDAAVLVATLSGAPALTASDLIIGP